MKCVVSVSASVLLFASVGFVQAACPRLATFRTVPKPAGVLNAKATGVAHDASALVGTFSVPGGVVIEQGFIWNPETGALTLLPVPTDWFSVCCPQATSFSTIPLGIANNAVVVTGHVQEFPDGRTKAFRWTPTGGMLNLTPEPFTYGSAADVTPNGVVLAGDISSASVASQAFRWTVGFGFEYIASGDGQPLSISCVSAGGDSIAGTVLGANPLAFRWTSFGGVQVLGDLPSGADASAGLAIAPDGSAVAGVGSIACDAQNCREAFLWSASTGFVPLGTLPGRKNSEALAISERGEIVVGVSYNTASDRAAFYWTARRGMRPLVDVLLERGAILPPGTRLIEATDLDDFGRRVVGVSANASGQTDGFIAEMAVECLADYNASGEADFFDFISFVDDYSARNICADVNRDGTIDFFDYLDFTEAFDAGCP
ncbi:MAG: hypothetical protein SFZ23_15135 [Planctomycetota bacterium]|nr:hypothetical protein [Planctomycetota bacterium]